MPKKKTHEEFIKEVYNLVGDQYSVLGNYTNATTKILMKHNLCGNEWKVTPTNFLNSKHKCPDCKNKYLSNLFSKTHKQFCKEIYDLVGNEYTVVGKYTNNHTKIEIKHNVCGYIHPVEPKHFLNDNVRCLRCSGMMPYTTETFKQKLNELVGNKFELISEYINTKTLVKLKHICGYEWEVTPNDFITSKKLCPECEGRMNYNTKTFKQKVFNLTNGEYELVDEYINNKTYIKFRHNICKQEYPARPDHFLDGNSNCPFCNLSKGENLIRKFLLKNKIKFIMQHSFDDCRGIKRPLPFDFTILNNNGKIIQIIEYDGEHHYKVARYSKDESKMLEKFKDIQRNDKIKNNYCKINNIPLLRIPYWEFKNIEQILEDTLNVSSF